MIPIRKKSQSKRTLLSQLDDFDQGVTTGNATCERQENITVNEFTNDCDFIVGTPSSNAVKIEIVENVKTWERCFNERINKETNNIVDTVEDRIQNAISTAFDNIVAPRIELAIRSLNASSGRDATSVAANSARGEHVGINTSFESASGNNNVQQVTNGNDETRNNILDEASELSVPETRFDRQTHTHHMLTGQTTQTSQNPEFLTGRILTPPNPQSRQNQNLSTQAPQVTSLPVVQQTLGNQESDANNSINRLAAAIAGIASQQ